MILFVKKNKLMKNIIILIICIMFLACNVTNQKKEKPFVKDKEYIFLGEKPEGDWYFYDKEHPYMLTVETATPKQKYCEKDEDRTLIEIFTVNGFEILKVKEYQITYQCSAIKYVIITDEWNYIIEYPDCGASEEFHKTAREFVVEWVKKNIK